MEFVNHKGERVIIGSRPSHVATPKVRAPAKKFDKDDPSTHGRHMGWAVGGYPPSMLTEARAEHEKDPANATKPWDVEVFMNGHKPRKARAQPYAIPDAANQCADLLRKAGWLRVTVDEVIRR